MFFFLEMYKEFQLLLDAKDDQKKEPYDFFIEVLWNKFRFRFLNTRKLVKIPMMLTENVEEENMTVSSHVWSTRTTFRTLPLEVIIRKISAATKWIGIKMDSYSFEKAILQTQ